MMKIVALRALRPLCGDGGILFAVLTTTTSLGPMMKQLSNSVVVVVCQSHFFFPLVPTSCLSKQRVVVLDHDCLAIKCFNF